MLTTEVHGGLVDVRAFGEAHEVGVREQDTVLTAPGARIDALEGEVGVELHDCLTAGMNFDPLSVGHDDSPRCARQNLPVGSGSMISYNPASDGRTRYT